MEENDAAAWKNSDIEKGQLRNFTLKQEEKLLETCWIGIKASHADQGLLSLAFIGHFNFSTLLFFLLLCTGVESIKHLLLKILCWRDKFCA